MEVAVIDWKSLDSKFVKDELYEHINAPKWVDFSAPEDSVEDEAWFCRPGCNHPKTVEDFFNEKQRTPPSNSKLKKSATVSNISPFGDRNNREAMLKKRGGAVNQPPGLPNKGSKYHKIVEDSENHNPNLSTPINHKSRAGKEAIKSSAEKKEFRDDTMMGKDQMPKLKSTLSARNLFSGGDILSKVAEFCNDLKKLALRTKDKESAENNMEKPPGQTNESFEGSIDKEKEWKPLLEVDKEKSAATDATRASKTPRRNKIINDDAENTPVSIDLKKVKAEEGRVEGLARIRTCPPTPQCFSAGCHKPPNDVPTPPKRFRPRPQKQERGILQEVKQVKNEEDNDESKAMIDHPRSKGEEGVMKDIKTLDVFWFLKPCTN